MNGTLGSRRLARSMVAALALALAHEAGAQSSQGDRSTEEFLNVLKGVVGVIQSLQEARGAPQQAPAQQPHAPATAYPQQPAPVYPSDGATAPVAAPVYPGQAPAYPSPAPPVYPAQAPAYPTQAPAYPAQAPGYPTQAPAYPSGGAQAGAPAYPSR